MFSLKWKMANLCFLIPFRRKKPRKEGRKNKCFAFLLLRMIILSAWQPASQPALCANCQQKWAKFPYSISLALLGYLKQSNGTNTNGKSMWKENELSCRCSRTDSFLVSKEMQRSGLGFAFKERIFYESSSALNGWRNASFLIRIY